MPILLNEFRAALQTGVPRQRHELEVRKSDGNVLPLGLSISILTIDGGGKKGIIALFQDLTEVHVMREKVRQADKMAAIGKLSAAIAHEIRAPLASICGSVAMLEGELELTGDELKLMQLIVKESDRLDRIITDFLEFARIRQPDLKPLDIEQCLNEVLLLLKHSLSQDESISMKIVSEASGAVINADEEQIKQVFLSLGLNACQAMCERGILSIHVKSVSKTLREGCDAQECIWIDFENDGPTIPEDVLPRIFEPFYTTKDEGTGLGLAVAAKIVESHAGLIRAESTERGGTVFSVILPLCTWGEGDREESTQEAFISF
jgi:two-component system sensor histidine kinase PilS (NtrC family)